MFGIVSQRSWGCVGWEGWEGGREEGVWEGERGCFEGEKV